MCKYCDVQWLSTQTNTLSDIDRDAFYVSMPLNTFLGLGKEVFKIGSQYYTTPKKRVLWIA